MNFARKSLVNLHEILHKLSRVVNFNIYYFFKNNSDYIYAAEICARFRRPQTYHHSCQEFRSVCKIHILLLIILAWQPPPCCLSFPRIFTAYVVETNSTVKFLYFFMLNEELSRKLCQSPSFKINDELWAWLPPGDKTTGGEERQQKYSTAFSASRCQASLPGTLTRRLA